MLEDLEIRGRDHPDYSINKISQNTKKSPGELRRLTVTQTAVKDHQPAVVWKADNKKYNNYIIDKFLVGSLVDCFALRHINLFRVI